MEPIGPLSKTLLLFFDLSAPNGTENDTAMFEISRIL
jgi:hypothetical protein